MTEEKEQEVCISCEEPIEEGEERITKEGKICRACYEYDRMTPTATVIYADGSRATVGQYHNMTDGDFETEWHSMNAWRGYHSIEANNGWKHLHEDCILSFSKDAKNLREFDEKLMEYAREHDIEMAKVISRTSNVCSSGYDLFVRCNEDRLTELKLYIESLEDKHRDPQDFKATALTGKDPEDLEEHDKKFVKGVKVMEKKDLSPRQAVEVVSEFPVQ